MPIDRFSEIGLDKAGFQTSTFEQTEIVCSGYEKRRSKMAKYEILLLGDGSHLFRTMAWVLEYKGYAVRAAISPETALEALVKKNYDLVIAKLSMAEADGVDLLLSCTFARHFYLYMNGYFCRLTGFRN